MGKKESASLCYEAITVPWAPVERMYDALHANTVGINVSTQPVLFTKVYDFRYRHTKS